MEHGGSWLVLIKLIVKNVMKKILLGTILGLSLGVSGITLAATMKSIPVTSYVLTVIGMPANSVKKIIDGSVTCYILQNGVQAGISCVK